MKPGGEQSLLLLVESPDKAAEMAQQTEDLEEFIPAVIDMPMKSFRRRRRCSRYEGSRGSGIRWTGTLEVISGAYDAFHGKGDRL